MTTLKSLGYNEFFRNQFDEYKNQNLIPGRVSAENKTNYLIHTEFGEITGEVTGKLLFTAESNAQLPKVGDWVLLNYFEDEKKGVIQNILTRKTKLSRKSAGNKTEEQVFAANIDVVFIVHPVDHSFNKNKLERQLVAAYQSKAEPVVILSKSDLCENTEQILKRIQKDLNVKLIPTSVVSSEGIKEILEILEPGKTYILIGSSGSGKSTLINKLFGEEILKTNEVRIKDSKGKHTTTRREMIILPSGAILIDTPGVREIQLWNADDGLSSAFSEFEGFENNCKYRDCSHTHEIGCAVIDALNKGLISKERYDNYLKMRKELQYLKTKQDFFAAKEKQKHYKEISKEVKRYYNDIYKRQK